MKLRIYTNLILVFLMSNVVFAQHWTGGYIDEYGTNLQIAKIDDSKIGFYYSNISQTRIYELDGEANFMPDNNKVAIYTDSYTDNCTVFFYLKTDNSLEVKVNGCADNIESLSMKGVYSLDKSNPLSRVDEAKQYFSKYMTTQSQYNLFKQSLPTLEDCKYVFKKDYAYVYFGYIEDEFKGSLNNVENNLTYSNCSVRFFTTENIKSGKGNYAGGMEGIQDFLNPQIVFYPVRYDGENRMTYKYFVNIKGRWVFFPKPWNAFSDVLQQSNVNSKWDGTYENQRNGLEVTITGPDENGAVNFYFKSVSGCDKVFDKGTAYLTSDGIAYYREDYIDCTIQFYYNDQNTITIDGTDCDHGLFCSGFDGEYKKK